MSISLAAILATPVIALANPILSPSNAARPVTVAVQSQTGDKFFQALRSLSLSEEQQAKLQSIFSTCRFQHPGSVSDAARQKLRSEILAVLTSKQRKQLQAQLSARGATPPMDAKLIVGSSRVGEVVDYRFEAQDTSPRGKQSFQESLEIKQTGANTLTVKFFAPKDLSPMTVPVQRLANGTLSLGSEGKPGAGGNDSNEPSVGSSPKRANGAASGQNGQIQALVAVQKYNQIARVAHAASGVPLQIGMNSSMTTTIGQGESLISIPLLVRVTEVSGNKVTLEADGSGSGIMQLPKPSARSRRRRILRAILLGNLLSRLGGGGSSFGSLFGGGSGSNGGSVPVVANVHYMAHFVSGKLDKAEGTEQSLISVQGQNVNATSSWLLTSILSTSGVSSSR